MKNMHDTSMDKTINCDDVKNWNLPKIFRKSHSVLIIGVCIFGVVSVTFYSLTNSSTSFAYGGFSKFKSYINVVDFKSAGTKSDKTPSIKDQNDDNLGNLSLESETENSPFENGTVSEHFLNLQIKNVSGNGNVSTISKSKAETQSPSTESRDNLLEGHPITTTMTFNKTLVVRCKESPYIQCVPPLVEMKSDKVFNISYVRKAGWHSAESFNVSLCPYNQCDITKNTVTKETEIVVVYGVGLRNTFKIPQRWQHQLFVISEWEPPPYSHSDYVTAADSKWSDQFNLTMTYRTTSDIFSPYSNLIYQPKPLRERPNYYDIAKSKNKTAVWFVSHCNAQSGRHLYVQEMQKHIDVDIFGSCGKPCPRTAPDCDNLPSKYKFYLSFENSLCTDYVTEKFFKLFVPGMHVIPVVRGGTDYDKYFPEFTYINAAHFKTPRDLALHLKSLAADLETYSKYLEYKDLYVKSAIGIDFACRLCEYLHTHELPKRQISNLKKSLIDKQCHTPNDLHGR